MEAPECCEESYYRAIIENALDVIMVVNRDGTIRYLSPSVKGVTGYDPDELAGTDVFEIVHPDDRGLCLSILDKGLSTPGYKPQGQFRLLHKDGSVRELEVVGSNLLEDPAVRGMVLNFRDVTERLHAQEELRANESLLRSITDSMLDMVAIVDKNAIFRYVSPSVEAVFGFAAEDVIGKAVYLYVHPDDVPSAKKQLQRCLERRETARLQYRGLRADGSYLWLETYGTSILDDKGNIIAANLTTRDIDDRKKMEQVLRESEERFRSLAESTSAGIFIFNDQGLCYVNPRIEEMTGYTGDELIGMDPLGMIHPGSRSRAGKEIDRIQEWNPYMKYNYEVSIVDREGREIWLDITAGYIEYQGKPAAICTAYDITERVRRGRELEQLNQDLRAFAHTLSHDLKSPLSNAYGYAVTIERVASDHLDAMSRKGLEVIKDSLESMGDIIDGMLSYTRMGNVPEEDRVVDLRMVVEDILDELVRGGRLDDASCTIRTELPVVSGDPTRFRQVFGNLLSNAVKFGEEGREARIEVGHLVSNGQSTVYVSDNGRGIANDDLQKIFEPLERAGMGRDVPGHGLGLAIVQRAVQSWRGRVWAESEPGRGSTFYFTLPAPLEVSERG